MKTISKVKTSSKMRTYRKVRTDMEVVVKTLSRLAINGACEYF